MFRWNKSETSRPQYEVVFTEEEINAIDKFVKDSYYDGRVKQLSDKKSNKVPKRSNIEEINKWFHLDQEVVMDEKDKI